MVLRVLVLLASGLLAFATGPMLASAAETRNGNEIVVGSEETVDGDLYLFGREVEINGTVNGDVVGAAETVMIRGTINGSLNIVARSIEINGTVARAARVSGQELILRGRIEGDLISAVNQMTITSNGSVGGDLLLASGDISLSGSVGGDVRGSANEISLGGAVAGSVALSANEITVSNRGRIAGDLSYASNVELEILGQGEVAGTVERTGSYRAVGGPDLFTGATSQIVRLLAGMIAGLVLIALFPAAAIRTADAIRTDLPIAAASGFIGLILWAILAVILTVILVGIPIALIGTLSLLVIAWLSQVFVGLALGRIVLPSTWKEHTRGYNILAMALGMLLVGVLRALPFPYISFAVAAFSAVLAVGAVIMALRPDRPEAFA